MGLLLCILDYGYNASCFVYSQAVSSSKVVISEYGKWDYGITGLWDYGIMRL